MNFDLKSNRYIIVEIIPTKIKDGIIVQLSALKLNGLMLEDRFDYRVIDELVPYSDLLKIISYDKDKFKYANKDDKIMKEFKKFIEDLPILYIDNSYTLNYLNSLKNKKISILEYFNLDYSDDVIDKLIDKYNLQESDYIVDLLYESLIKEL